uniref:Uncharacterized protein n=1 Tax=Streptomyces sp. F2 TaxID=317660 RepID=V9Z5B0_9ACTN|nr:hypothetical protein [Streptomyces sp. F2]AHE39293.1 hypothetical protein pFRL4_60c [Streptomyces sp. F2]
MGRRACAGIGEGEDLFGVPMGDASAVQLCGGGGVRGDALRTGQGSVGDARRVELLVVVDDRVPARVAGHVNHEAGVAVEQALVNGAVVADEVLMVHLVSTAPRGGVLAFGGYVGGWLDDLWSGGTGAVRAVAPRPCRRAHSLR